MNSISLIRVRFVLISLFFFAVSQSASAAVSFVRGASASFTVCQNASGVAFDSAIAITDPAVGLTETWTVLASPTRGSLSRSSYVTPSTGGFVLPTGWSYTPSGSFTGLDTFSVQVSNGTDADTIAVIVTINPSPTVGAITGSTSQCVGATVTLANSTGGGVWFSTNPSVATISSSGSLNALSAGTTSIIYTVTNGFGCASAAFAIDTVLTVPSVSATTGSPTVCVSFTTTLTNGTSGGVWSTSDASIASVNSSGVVSGVSGGSATISYTVTNACGSNSATFAITVNTFSIASILPAGSVAICVGADTLYSNATVGGSWSSSTPSVASVSSTGRVFGITTGTATIFYTLTNSCGTTNVFKTITVNGPPATPASITGAVAVCLSDSTTLSCTTPGGVWSSSDPSVASINSSTGVVRGNTVGSATISYTVTNGCGSTSQTRSISVGTAPAAPASISGISSICVGATTALTNITSGGVWSTSAASVASIDASGTVYGVSAGSADISYTVSNSCGSTSTSLSFTVNTTPTAPLPISGADTVCSGATTTLSNLTVGGAWSSFNTSIATVTSGGVVRGVTVGSTIISYTMTNACGSTAATLAFRVNGVPSSPSSITGSSSVCRGSTITLSSATTGGVWSSSNTSVATVSTAGVVTGVAAGPVTISYTVSNSCGSTSTTASITVTTVPSVAAILGSNNICNGATTTLTNATGSGTWSSTNPSVATINSSGLVTALSAGTTRISYTVSNACGPNADSINFTVTNPPVTPAAISGSSSVCAGSTITLTNSTSGGVWTSSAPSTASITAGGVLRGVTTGSVTVSYTVSNFCGAAAATSAITVITTPVVPIITGAGTVCVSGTTTLSNATSGGIWSTTDASRASVGDTTGVVFGVASGTANISYTVTNACGSTARGRAMTISAPPASPGAISGAASVCVGATSPFINATGGGSWSSSATSIATINSGTGALTGVAGGSVTITYTVSNSCGSTFVTRGVTITTTPVLDTIAGASAVCSGSTITLTNTTGGGLWSSSAPSLASVTTGGGVVRGVAVGSVTITYTASNSCGSSNVTRAISVITVPSLPAIIGGPTSVCAGSTITVTNSTAGGTWSSNLTSSATVDASGVVTGVSAGTPTISYTMTNSCGSIARTRGITVLPPTSVAAIGGTATVCTGNLTTLTNITSGGTWSISDASVATINTSGIVTGLTAGSATVSYTVVGTCGTASATRTLTVNTVPPVPSAISGTTSVCAGSTSTLSSATTGGTWSSANNAIASVVPTTGVVRGNSGGTTTISYTSTNTCGSTSTTASFTVNTVPAAPAAIAGRDTACIGGTTTLTNDSLGGVWSSSNTGQATVSTSGVVSGLTLGSPIISYTLTNGCGPTSVVRTVRVITLPSVAAISGSAVVCVGSTTTLGNITAGGTWSSSNTSIATVSNSGVVFGLMADTVVTISYTVTNLCGSNVATRSVRVNTVPVVGAISGPTQVCAGSTVALADTTIGGVWSSSAPGIASVSSIGVVQGVTPGSVTISYTKTNACGPTSATYAMDVITIPTAPSITGATRHCVGSTVTLSSSVSGGTWFSSNTAVATVSSGGVVTGVSAGTTIIVYSVTNSCGTNIASVTDTVNSGTIDPITGPSAVCRGSNITLASTTTGGTWSSSNFSIATVNPTTGVVRGSMMGTATITYSVTNACGTSTINKTITVDTSSVAPIVGLNDVCVGSTITLTNASAGGVWTSTVPSIASVDGSTGVVTGVAGLDSTVVVYTLTNSCGAFPTFKTVRVYPLANPGVISGPTALCVGTNIALSTTGSGGVWSSGNPLIASVNSATGDVTGVGAGTILISYSVTGFCGAQFDTATVVVNPLPDAGSLSVSGRYCVNATMNLNSSVSGGTWSSSNTAVASVITGFDQLWGVGAGNVTISYMVTNVCGTDTNTIDITINPIPTISPISGPPVVCVGSLATFTATPASGTWLTSDASIASVGGSTGDVSGISAGTATITYEVVDVFSCYNAAYASVIIDPLPDAGSISGSSVCEDASRILSSTVGGGTWSTADAAIASIEASTGLVSGIAAGSTTISYTVTSSFCGSATATTSFTVNPRPTSGSISGASSVCQNANTTLVASLTGGTWGTSDATVASVSTTGVVTGVAAGVATITYSITSICGTADSVFSITVNPLPSAGILSGPTSVCPGATIGLSSTVAGGTWSSSDLSIASIDASGTVTGIATGTATITYSATNICGTADSVIGITVLPLPFAGELSGITNFCQGTTSIFTSTVTGGTWSSSNLAVASINSTTGLALGRSGGSAIITYSYTNSCGTHDTTINIVINPLPVAGAITGGASVCERSVLSLTATPPGGTWSVSPTSIATINSLTGILRGVAAGTVTVQYRVTNLCGADSSTASITVLPLPFAGEISGSSTVCEGATTTLTSSVSTGGGTFTWSSSDATVAGVSAGGLVSGVSAGSATITYTHTNSCGTHDTTFSITVNPLPIAGAVFGVTSLCERDTSRFTTALSGGVWSSSAPGTASVSATGLVYGVSAGSAFIIYKVTNSCGVDSTIFPITINIAPLAGNITGSSFVCQGSTATLANPTARGSVATWSSSNPSVATISSTGVVSGLLTGTVVITYSASTAFCGTATDTALISVLPVLTAGTMLGSSSLCAGRTETYTLSGADAGGTWSSSHPTRATVSTTGDVSAVYTGTGTVSVTISYTVGNSCGTSTSSIAATVTAAPTVGAISGVSSICEASSSLFTATSAGMTSSRWSTSNEAVATVDPSTGNVTGVAAGSAVISYTVYNACDSASLGYSVTVRPLPITGTITGTLTLCVGDTTRLVDTAVGGTWRSSSTGVATISSTGLVTARSGGTTTISYTVSNSCGTLSATASLLVNPLPNAGSITGGTVVCESATLTLGTTGSSGGSWSSSDLAVASVVSSTGVVHGVGTGTATITYIHTTPCGEDTAIHTVTVNPRPRAGTIFGLSTVCTGTTITLGDTTSSGAGVWTSSVSSVASVTGGSVLGRSVGSTVISYTVTNSCGTDVATFTVGVLATPSAGSITVPSLLCAGSSATLTTTGATPGGRWSSTLPSIATIDTSSGAVRAIAGGTTVISYTVTSASCGTFSSTATLAVTPRPDAGVITGFPLVCRGSFITLTDTSSTSTGTWTTSSASIASVNSAGTVYGIGVGSAIISYSVSNACGTATDTMMVTVLPLPSGGSIVGASTVCVGADITLTNPTATAGGIWFTSSSSAVVDLTSGVVTGVAAGTAVITYSITSPYCGSATATTTITVEPLPDAGTITGVTAVCAGLSSTLTASVSGGTWTVTPSGYASVSSGGVVSTTTAGTVTVSYTVSTARCGSASTSIPFTINPLPDPGTITGGTNVCIGSTLALSSTGTAGGSWSMPTSSFATIDASGVVSGLSVGTVTVTYTVTTATCGSASTTATISVLPLPDAGSLGLTTGRVPFCERDAIVLTPTATGGTWSSSNPSIASVSSTGRVVGTGGGTAVISYSVASASCGSAHATFTVTVDPLPVIPAISGASSVCLNDSTLLTNALAGGTWTSSDTTIARIDASGMVHGLRVGSAVISYSASNACGVSVVTMAFRVNPLPNAGVLSGPTSVCVTSTVTLSSTVSGGTWSSSSTSVAVGASSGAISGVSTGVAIVTYSVGTASCGSAFATRSVTVITIPVVDTIRGVDSLCSGLDTSLTIVPTGGLWTSSDPAIASIVSTRGDIYAVSAGTATISYVLTNACGADTAIHSFTVLPDPFAGVITGTSSLCAGIPETLSVSATGGAWSSSNTTVATVDAFGSVVGLAPGNDTIFYTVVNSCGVAAAIKVVTVNPIPDAGTVVGRNWLCIGDSLLFTTASTMGFWLTSNAAIAAVRPSGMVIGIAPGDAIITYKVVNYCGVDSSTFALNVRPDGRCGPDDVPVVTNELEINIYPNPVNSVLHISGANNIHAAIISPDGKVMMSMPTGGNDLDVRNLVPGMYMILVYDENENLLKSARFIKVE